MQIDPAFLQNAPSLAEKIRAEQARRSFKAFIEQAWHVIEPGRPLVWGWALDAMVEHLEAVANGDIRKLAIFVPPGFGKSRLTRVFYPTWRWTASPYHKFLSASYGIDLTVRDTLDARRIVTSDWYENTFNLSIAEDDGGRTGFSLKSLGTIKAITVGGKTTGFRGDTVLFDDLIGVQDANSPSKRAEANEWFRESAQNRVNDLNLSSRILIMQRVHQDDPGALAMKMGYEPLIIPMEWDESLRRITSIGWTDPRTEPGELAFPERFPKVEVDNFKDAETGIGAFAYSAQYQQQPVPRKGAMFDVDRIKLIDRLPDEPFITIRAWDLAGSEGKGAYTVGVRMRYGRESRGFYIDDVRRAQLSAGEVRKLIADTAEDDGVEVKISLPRDPGQAGMAQIEDLTAMLAGYNVRAEAQSGSKEVRAEPLAGHVENGHVHVLQESWTPALLDEMRFFPRGKYMDQVDAASSAFNTLAPLSRAKKRSLTLVAGGERQANWATGPNDQDEAIGY
jgi:predicted phage terminase large subunit-like protein